MPIKRHQFLGSTITAGIAPAIPSCAQPTGAEPSAVIPGRYTAGANPTVAGCGVQRIAAPSLHHVYCVPGDYYFRINKPPKSASVFSGPAPIMS